MRAPVAVQGLRDLDGELARGHEHERDRRAGAVGPEALQERQREGGGLAGSGRGLPEQVLPASSGGIASRWIGVGSS